MTRREWLTELIELAALTHAEVARAAGCTRAYVTFMVQGYRPVTDQVLEAAERLASERVGELIVRVGLRLTAGAPAA